MRVVANANIDGWHAESMAVPTTTHAVPQEMGSRAKGGVPVSGQPCGMSALVSIPHVCVVVMLPSVADVVGDCHSYTHLAVDVLSAGPGKRRHEAGRDGLATGGAAQSAAGRPFVLLRSAPAPGPAGLEWTADITATSVKVLGSHAFL